jgi:tetratricopeptide (TPR) repeat protein
MKFLFLLISVSFYVQLNAQTPDDQSVIKASKNLIADKKYESAYKKLQEYDPNNGKPDIVLLKEDIALKYFVTSIMHQMFSFKDIQKNEDIRDYRGKNGSASVYILPVNKILDSLLLIYPQNYKLNKGLGDYYYQVYLKYGNSWIMKEKELLEKVETNYKIAIEHNITDFQSYYGLGYVLIVNGNYQEGIPYLSEAIKLDNNSADAHYNIAYAYLSTNDLKNALLHGKESITLYKDTAEKADAARLVATTYAEMKNFKKAAEYGELSNTIEPYNYYTLKNLLGFYFELKKDKKIKSATEAFYNLGPEKPTIYNDLIGIYTDNKREKDIIDFFNSKIPAAANNKTQLGSLYFYLGRLYVSSDKAKAKEYLVKARDILSEVYPKDHQVFKVIDETLKNLK